VWSAALSPRLLVKLGGLGVVALLAGLSASPLLSRFSPAPPASSGSAAAVASAPSPASAAPAIADSLPAAAASAITDAATGPATVPSSLAASGPPDTRDLARRPVARAPQTASAAPAAPPASSAAAATPPPDPLLELSMLDQARRKSASAPAEALALASEHARLFPRSAFGTEREVIVIETLQRAGRADEAQARARRFLEASPRSAYRERLERLLR
jgi:hypothetical protein